MAFVAPEAALPAVIKQFSQDLDPKQMESVGPTEAAIFRTPEGTPYINWFGVEIFSSNITVPQGF